MVGYSGPNRAGKSTTIEMLTGTLVPASGEVISDRFSPWSNGSRYANTIGAAFGHRGSGSFRLLKEIYGVSDSDYAARMKEFDQVLELGRYLRTPVRKLSLGERMRCDVAAALIHNPPLVFRA